jgi:hypothetical protein
MLWLATAAIAASTPVATSPGPVVVEARATVRIVSGVRLKLDSPTNSGAPRAHETTLRADGVRRDARLIEFQ